MKERVAVLGSGSWGTTFALVLADAGSPVAVWGRRDDVCTAIRDAHRNPEYLPGVELPSPGDRVDGPGRGAGRRAARRARRPVADAAGEPDGLAAACSSPTPSSCRLMKGVELGTLRRMSEVIGEVAGAGPERVAVVSGPNLAKEIAARQPTATVVACDDHATADRVAHACSTPSSARTRTPTSWAARSAVR